MIPGGVGLLAWESRVLAGLSIWTVKLLELVAGFGVEKSTEPGAKVPSCMVESIILAILPTKVQIRQAIKDLYLPSLGQYSPRHFRKPSLIPILPDP